MKKRNCMIYILVLIVSSIVIGYIYGLNTDYSINDYLSNISISHNNYYLYIIVLLLISLISTLSFIGILTNSILIGFESISVGYIISQFYKFYKLKGILYSIINIFINKAFIILIIVYLFYVSYLYTLKLLKNINGISKDSILNFIKPLIIKYIFIFIVLMIYSTIIYFFGNKLLDYFSFILK